ncbi:glycosyltransferase family 4 protein [Thalassotalea marina]|uniref:Glycosyltransferase family 1 protein n=1 Tax=Thalassotalea marina TaxID=1673741 RepID=A0A919BBM7_9GAMM|nr:glycosyltransferase family 4 protein [Thalassotalea marina]GHF80962.1 hypothetical protein GCM10017161_05350 [Thalassotalea marina]
MNKIKIAHVQVLPILSGVQNISLDVLNGLDSAVYDKYLICADDDIESEEFATRFAKAGVTILRVKSLKREIGIQDMTALKDLFSLFKSHQFDIVHSHSTKPGILARIAARFAGVKAVIHTIHGVAFHKNEPWAKRLFFYLVECVASLFGHYLTSVSAYYRPYYPYIRDKKFRVIYNGIPVTLPIEDIRHDTNRNDKLSILFLSRIERAKDPLTLLKATKLLKNRYNRTDFNVKIAGDGELMAQCQYYVEQNELSDVVEFLGWVTDKTPVYQQADIFCVPSIFEAFGLVFAEAGLYELPTVATNVEGIPEVIAHEKTGLLVAPHQPEQVAEKLNYLLDHPDERLRLGKAAKERILNNFTTQRMVDEYEQLYRQALT